MSDRILPHGLFHTPASMQEVEDWINKHPPEQHAHLYTAAYMTWNYLASVVNKTTKETPQ